MYVLVYLQVLLAKCCIIPMRLGDLPWQRWGDVLFQNRDSSEQHGGAASLRYRSVDLAARSGGKSRRVFLQSLFNWQR